MGSQYLPKVQAALSRPSSQPSRPSAAGSMPAAWSLWRPENGIVFGEGAASGPSIGLMTTTTATTTKSIATPRAVAPQVVNMPLVQQPLSFAHQPQVLIQQAPRRTIVFAQQSTARFVHTTASAATGSTERMEDSGKDDCIAKEEEKETDVSETKEVLPAMTTLDYKIPDDLFRKARDAAEGSADSFWSYTLYRKVKDNKNNKEDQDSKDGKDTDATVKVHYCRSKNTTERVCREYFANEPVLGFDLEWMHDATKWQGARRNVCLVQLASPSRIGLFHLSLYPTQELMAPALRSILESPDIIKTGVFIKGDATRLRSYLSVNMRGIFELSHLHRLVKYSQTGELKLINKKLVSLATQVQENLRLPLFKGQDVRAGDWSKPLRMDQIIYSASDAYAAVQLFSALERERENLDPKPPRPALAELNLPIKLADGVAASAAAEAVADEAEQQEELAEEGGSTAPLSPELAADAEKTIQFEAESDDDSGSSCGVPATKGRDATKAASPKTSRTTKTSKPRNTSATPKDARIVAAEEWLARYRSAGRSIHARPASLRAYYIWHNDSDMDPASLAALLHDPPLQTSTVISYILEAVRLEGLPYHKPKLREELLEALPENIRMTRYRMLARACGYTAKDNPAQDTQIQSGTASQSNGTN